MRSNSQTVLLFPSRPLTNKLGHLPNRTSYVLHLTFCLLLRVAQGLIFNVMNALNGSKAEQRFGPHRWDTKAALRWGHHGLCDSGRGDSSCGTQVQASLRRER